METNSGNIIINDVYKIDEKSNEITMVLFGNWNQTTGLHVVEQSIWRRRSNLRGHQFR